jgi:hypothetical protein
MTEWKGFVAFFGIRLLRPVAAASHCYRRVGLYFGSLPLSALSVCSRT